MAVASSELYAVWRWLLATRLLWWLLGLAVLAPVAMVAKVELASGPLPWLEWGPGIALFPTGGLALSYAAFTRAARCERGGLAALESVWHASPLSAYVAEVIVVLAIAGCAAALVTVAVVLLSLGTPAIEQGMGAAADLWLMLLLDYALLWSIGALVGSRWQGPGGALLAVAGPAAVAAGTVLPANTAGVPPTVPTALTHLLAMSPWTLLAGMGSDVWGFGGAKPLFTAVAVLTASATLAFTLAAVRRRLRLVAIPWTIHAAALVMPLAALAWVSLDVWSPASPSPTPPVLRAASPAIAQESIAVRFSPIGALTATAVIRPADALEHLWINPGLKVSVVSVGGRSVPFARRGGYIDVAPSLWRGATSVTVGYWGQLDEFGLVHSVLATEAFSSGAGAYLPGGSWYPVVPPSTGQVENPAVARYRLTVVSQYPTVLTNLGVFRGTGQASRRTTGVTLVAGHFTRTLASGFSEWAGPAETAALRQRGILGAPIQRESGAFAHFFARSALASTLLHATRLSARSMNVVNLQFADVPPGLLALDNPNPELATSPYDVLSEARVVRYNGIFPYSFAPLPPFEADSSQIALMWSAVSPRWTKIGTGPAFSAWPTNQLPADLALVWLKERWSRFGYTGATTLPAAPDPLTKLSRSEVARFWRLFRRSAAKGWPTQAEIDGWIRSVRGRGGPP